LDEKTNYQSLFNRYIYKQLDTWILYIKRCFFKFSEVYYFLLFFTISFIFLQSPWGMIKEPNLKEETFYNSEVIKDFEEFKKRSDLIITNWMYKELKDVEYKVYTRDLYGRDWWWFIINYYFYG